MIECLFHILCCQFPIRIQFSKGIISKRIALLGSCLLYTSKPAGMIIWFLYYAFLVATGLELLFPPQFLLVGNIFMVFMISTITRKESLKRRCISTLLICTVWMLVEVIVLLVLEAVGTDESVINDAGSFASKMCMLLFSVLLGRYAKKKQYAEIPLRYFIIIPVSYTHLDVYKRQGIR